MIKFNSKYIIHIIPNKCITEIQKENQIILIITSNKIYIPVYKKDIDCISNNLKIIYN